MATQAGVINTEGPSSDEAFRVVIAEASPLVQELASAVRDLVYDVFPATVEVVWERQRSVGWGVGPKKFTEQFAYLMPFTKHMTLGFYRGGELPDPEGLLPTGGGRQVAGTLSMRSVRISSLDQVHQPALRALIEASTHTVSDARAS